MEIYGDPSWVQRSILFTLFAARNLSSRDSDCAWETAPLNTLDLGSKTWQTSTNVTSIQLFISFDHTRKYRVHWSPAKCKGFDYAFQLQHSKPSEYHHPAGENSRTDNTTQQDTWDIRSNYLSEGHKDSYVPVPLLPNLMAKRTVRPLKRSATADFKNTIHNIESVGRSVLGPLMSWSKLVVWTITFQEVAKQRQGWQLRNVRSSRNAVFTLDGQSLCWSMLVKTSRGTEIYIQSSLKID